MEKSVCTELLSQSIVMREAISGKTGFCGIDLKI